MINEPNKIRILILGEEYHAKAFCKRIKNYERGFFEPKYISKVSKYRDYSEFDLFHLISTPLPVIRKLSKFKKPIFYHWIGTDVYRFYNDSFIKRQFKKYFIYSPLTYHLAGSENLKIELNQFNVKSKVLPLVEVRLVKDIPPLPEKFCVLTYVPFKSWEFYNGDMILELAEKLPDVDFHLLAAKGKKNNLPNVFTYGFVDDVNPFYKNSSVLLRITTHDGYAKMVIEALSYGRHVIRNMQFPHCYNASDVSECLDILNRLKSNCSLNIEGKKFVESSFNESKIMNDYYQMCNDVLLNQ